MISYFTIVILFMIGSFAGWIIELFYRSIIEEKKIVNPGFLSGPYLPIYGLGIITLFIISSLDIHLGFKIPLFGLTTTLLELTTGLIFDRVYKIKLWDYTDKWGNIKGMICPLATFYWTSLATGFYFFVYPFVEKIINVVLLEGRGLVLVGFFYGIFTMDIANSFQVATNIRHQLIKLNEKRASISFENLKLYMQEQVSSINFIDKYIFTLNNALKIDFRSHIKKFIRKSRRKSR